MQTIIPAMDIREGKVVRLTQGDFSKQTTYSEKSPILPRNDIVKI